MSKNGEIYTAGKNFTLPPALTGWTNSTSGLIIKPSKIPKLIGLWVLSMDYNICKLIGW